jgi:hypothetical protein
MTHPNPQAAPPETDLRERPLADMDDKEVIYRFRDACCAWHRQAISTNYDHLYRLQDELERRLARPDALREKVMAAIDDWWNSWRDEDIDALKAAVVAVLEETS